MDKLTLEKLKKISTWFLITFTIGILVKYNYLLLNIFYVNNYFILAIHNIIFMLIVARILVPCLNKKMRMFLFIVADGAYTFFFYANLWYNRYFGNYLSLKDMAKGRTMRPMKVLTRQLFEAPDLFFILDIVILLVLYYKITVTKHKWGTDIFNIKHKHRFTCLVMILLLLSQVGISSYNFSTYKPNEMYEESTAMFANAYGIFPIYAYEAYMNMNKDKANSNFQEEYPIKNHKPDLMEPKPELNVEHEEFSHSINLPEDTNVMIIQVESLDNKLIDYKYNDTEVIPFINELKDKGLYFDNVYAQHVNGSFDAEFSILTSLYPINKNYSFETNDMSKFDSLINIFNEKEYETLAFHGNKGKFFSRTKGYAELGYDKFYSRKDYDMENSIINESFYLGINDYDFFNQSFEYLKESENPFFSYLITVTSHTPFNFYPERFECEEFKPVKNQFVEDYFQSARFVDESIKMFYERMQEEGMLDDTVIVLIGDHNADVNKDEYVSADRFELKRKLKAPENIPMIVLHPDIEPGVNHTTGTVTDIGPTLMDMLGFDDKPEEFLGHSLLNEEERPVFFIHEVPQILFKDQLFMKHSVNVEGEYEYKRVGWIKGKNDPSVSLTDTEKDGLKNKIDYIEYILKERITEIEKIKK